MKPTCKLYFLEKKTKFEKLLHKTGHKFESSNWGCQKQIEKFWTSNVNKICFFPQCVSELGTGMLISSLYNSFFEIKKFLVHIIAL